MVDPSRKVPDLNCEIQDPLLEVVVLKYEVPDLRSGGIPPCNLTPGSLRRTLLVVCSPTHDVETTSLHGSASTPLAASTETSAQGSLGSRVIIVLDSGAEGPGSNRSRDAVG